MRVAVIGSRNLTVKNMEAYLPVETSEIITGGARGVDTDARDYAIQHNLKLTEYLPEYERYGRAAPLKRNDLIIQSADMVIAFWDGKSRGTSYVINRCRKTGTPCEVHMKKP